MTTGAANRPLAERMRPERIEEFAGQRHLLGADGFLASCLAQRRVPSLLLWGPPGCGKTTLARLVAASMDWEVVRLSAVSSGVREIREAERRAGEAKRRGGHLLLFLDEIHRFSKSQQDALLPPVEEGRFTLIGATTENPSFHVISPLLSRCQVLVLHPLSAADLELLLDRALADERRGLGALGLKIEDRAKTAIVQLADGDARRALSLLEGAAMLARGADQGITAAHVASTAQRPRLRYDRQGEEHYNLVSALHKSLRDSDPDGAAYWLGRMVEAGEDPLYIARRLVRFASEDVGNADPQALQLALAAKQAFEFLGSPEGELALYQAAVYLATAPKSNAAYQCQRAVESVIRESGALPVPMHLRNAPTRLMRELGYGRGYRYAHDEEDALVPQEHLPAPLQGKRFYHPSGRGFEAVIRDRLEKWRRVLARRRRNR